MHNPQKDFRGTRRSTCVLGGAGVSEWECGSRDPQKLTNLTDISYTHRLALHSAPSTSISIPCIPQILNINPYHTAFKNPKHMYYSTSYGNLKVYNLEKITKSGQ